MNKYLTPNQNGDKFTVNKHYQIMHDYGNGRYLVQNDKGEAVIVRADGHSSARLNGGGEFRLCSDLLNQALNVSKDAVALAMRERIRDAVGERIKDGSLWETGANPLAERLRKAEHEREQYKADCIKAEAVIDQLYDMFPHVKNADQLIAAVKTAKIFSDAFIELQKLK